MKVFSILQELNQGYSHGDSKRYRFINIIDDASLSIIRSASWQNDMKKDHKNSSCYWRPILIDEEK